ncbi:FkbM family methyltransferase [Conexibacter sp. SYSU D00693]|uniref:FkbM family methyltransferase n=1 Tax=Conexibacter sp. SYSU D00693 TaxID=2812560 RepID=UPI00196AC3D8|nr:FkbM family methyltransferase [Conexibacter sp. SYSU D00693]
MSASPADRAKAAAAEAKARLRPVVKDVLARAGLEVRRTGGGGPRRTLPEVLAHLQRLGLRPGAVVDVGVARGTPDLYAAFPGLPVLLVEPLAEHEGDLKAICAARPGSAYALAAAGPQPGKLEIAVHRVPACSSVLGDREPDGTPAPRRTVPVVRVDDLVANHALPGPFVVKVDVEGAELQVLEGARETLAQTDVVLLEVSFFQLVPGGAELADVVAWMRAAGFSPYDVYQGHLRPLDGALAQVDMAFVRDDGPFRADHRYATPAQADALYRRWGY